MEIKGLNSIPKESFIPQESVTITQYDPAVKFDYKKWNLITIKDIKQGEELTLTYTFYKI